MKKNLYYRNVLQRRAAVLSVFEWIPVLLGSPARLLLEVFIRKDFGERYFSFSKVITLSIFLAVIPLFGSYFNSMLGGGSFWPHYLTWYLYIAAFIVVSYKHDVEMKHNPSVFDFARYSLSSGNINPLFYKIQLPTGRPTDRRVVECFIEPAFFFAIGLVLLLLQQRLGWLITVSSIFYGVSYAADWRAGDHFVMDKIDEMIVNKELEESFVLDQPGGETASGFHFVGRKPKSEAKRVEILDRMFEDDAVDAV